MHELASQTELAHIRATSHQNTKKNQWNLIKISTKSIPRRVPKASKSSKMMSRKRLGATLAPRSDFCLIFDPSWRPIWAPRPPQELHKAPKMEPKASQDELQASPNHAQNQYEISTRFWSPLRCQNCQKNVKKTWKNPSQIHWKTLSPKKKRFLKKTCFRLGASTIFMDFSFDVDANFLHKSW